MSAARVDSVQLRWTYTWTREREYTLTATSGFDATVKEAQTSPAEHFEGSATPLEPLEQSDNDEDGSMGTQ